MDLFEGLGVIQADAAGGRGRDEAEALHQEDAALIDALADDPRQFVFQQRRDRMAQKPRQSQGADRRAVKEDAVADRAGLPLALKPNDGVDEAGVGPGPVS